MERTIFLIRSASDRYQSLAGKTQFSSLLDEMADSLEQEISPEIVHVKVSLFPGWEDTYVSFCGKPCSSLDPYFSYWTKSVVFVNIGRRPVPLESAAIGVNGVRICFECYKKIREEIGWN